MNRFAILRYGSELKRTDGANIWVSNSGDNTVAKLLASTGAVLGTYGVADPGASIFDGTSVWILSGGGTATKLLAY